MATIQEALEFMEGLSSGEYRVEETATGIRALRGHLGHEYALGFEVGENDDPQTIRRRAHALDFIMRVPNEWVVV